MASEYTIHRMSPTVFRHGRYRFYFFSREENRQHVHVTCADGEAKFWLVPEVSLAENCGLSAQQITEARKLIEEHRDDIADRWRQHFRG
jgi:hypothetical protein